MKSTTTPEVHFSEKHPITGLENTFPGSAVVIWFAPTSSDFATVLVHSSYWLFLYNTGY